MEPKRLLISEGSAEPLATRYRVRGFQPSSEWSNMKICTFEDCGKPHRCKGLCGTHYQQQLMGKPLTTRKPKQCSVAGCNGAHKAKDLCKMHHQRFLRTGDPSIVREAKHKTGPDSVHWAGREITYDGFHRRLRRTRGLAASLRCEGCSNQAAHWSYDHTDPSEITSNKGPFSTDLDRYQPMCVRCHSKFDRSRPKATV